LLIIHLNVYFQETQKDLKVSK